MQYGEDTTRIASDPQRRSWERLRAALSAPNGERPGPPRRFWLALGALAAGAAVLVTFILLQPVEAVVAAGRGELTAVVDGKAVALRVGDRLRAGAIVRTAADSWVALRIDGDTLSIDEKTEIVISELARFAQRRVIVQQSAGRTWNVLASDPGRTYVVRTSSGEVAAKGTAFLLSVPPTGNPELVTAEGVVELRAVAGRADVSSGHRAELSAAPPKPEPVPTTELSATAAATVVDALGRTCGPGASELPGCLATARQAFTLLPGIGREVSLRVRAPAAGTVGIAAGEVKKEITIPGQGTFRIKVVVSASGSTLKVEVRDTAKRVKEAPPGSEEAKREAESAAREAQEAAEKATRKAEEAAAKAAAKAAEAAAKAREAQASGSEEAKKAAAKAAEEAREAAEKAKESADEADEEARDAAEEAREAQRESAEKARKAAEEAAKKARKAAKEAAEKAKEAEEEAKTAAKDAAKQAKEACEAAAEKSKEEAKSAADREKDQAKAAADRAKDEAKQAEEKAKAECDKAADKDACKKAAEDARATAEQAAEKAKGDAERAAETKKEAAESAAKQQKDECEKAFEKAKEAQRSPKPSPPASPEPARSPEPSPSPTGRP